MCGEERERGGVSSVQGFIHCIYVQLAVSVCGHAPARARTLKRVCTALVRIVHLRAWHTSLTWAVTAFIVLLFTLVGLLLLLSLEVLPVQQHD